MKEKVTVNCNDGEGGVYDTQKVVGFLKSKGLDISIDQFLKDESLVNEFHTKHF